MIFTEEDKAFVKIFEPYYRLWTTDIYERIPWQTTKNVWIAQPYHEAAYKGDVQAHAWSSISPTVLKPNERRDRLFGLKLVCW